MLTAPGATAVPEGGCDNDNAAGPPACAAAAGSMYPAAPHGARDPILPQVRTPHLKSLRIIGALACCYRRARHPPGPQ